MKLIGSVTSPFVRKVRLVLGDQDYEFETLVALSPESSKLLEPYGPVKRVPILLVDDMQLFDSSIICEYLLSKKGISLSIDDKLTLKLIDELCDSCILLFQHKIWKIDLHWNNELCKRLLSRVFGVLDLLEIKISKTELTQFQEDWLYCVIDWLSFRNVIDWKDNHPLMEQLYQSLQKSGRFDKTQLG